jgi:DNA repair/transcription protein MET18/MMS19
LKDPAVRGTVALIEIPGFLAKEEVEELVRGLDEIVIHERDSEVR